MYNVSRYNNDITKKCTFKDSNDYKSQELSYLYLVFCPLVTKMKQPCQTALKIDFDLTK